MNKHQLIGALMAVIPAVGQFYLGHYGVGLLFSVWVAVSTYITVYSLGYLGILALPIILGIYWNSYTLFIGRYKEPDQMTRGLLLFSIVRGLIGAAIVIGLVYLAFTSAMNVLYSKLTYLRP